MKRSSTVLILLFGAAAAQAALQSDRPQPVDSAQAQENPEQREPPRKATAPAADDTAGETPTSFEQLDDNRDGKLSKDELGADEANRMDFSTIDRDGDGAISRDEWKAHWSGRHDKL